MLNDSLKRLKCFITDKKQILSKLKIKAYSKNCLLRYILIYIHFIERNKKRSKTWSKDLEYEKPFGYRVIHQDTV